MKLHATKTSLYKLTAYYHAPLPKMKHTRFKKLYRQRTYFLEWGVDGAASIRAVGGTAYLIIERHGNTHTFQLSVEVLREFNMIDEKAN